MKANTKVSYTANYDKANVIWYQKMTPMQRGEIIVLFTHIKSITKCLRACLNHVADNLVQYEN